MWSYYFIMKNIYIFFSERNVPEWRAKLTQDMKCFFTVRGSGRKWPKVHAEKEEKGD